MRQKKKKRQRESERERDLKHSLILVTLLLDKSRTEICAALFFSSPSAREATPTSVIRLADNFSMCNGRLPFKASIRVERSLSSNWQPPRLKAVSLQVFGLAVLRKNIIYLSSLNLIIQDMVDKTHLFHAFRLVIQKYQ